MNTARLLAHYDEIADAPDAIPSLRCFVLDLAVRGKLVLQVPEDEPASELLKRIAAEKALRAKEDGSKPRKESTALGEDPFEVPSGWRWSQLAEIGLLNPRNEAPDDREVSFVPMALIPASYGVPHGQEARPWREIKKGYTHFSEGDVGLAKITPCFENGKSTVFRNLFGGVGAGTTELHIVRPVFVDPNYILIFLKSPHFIVTGTSGMTGTAGQKRVPFEYFAYSPFPLPPLAEQHRIVSKVDELMALCDRLDAARVEREATRNKLTTASLARLNVSGSDTFRADAQFALDALPTLTMRVGQITTLRQTILNLAVTGKLGCTTQGEMKPVGAFRSLQNGYAFKSGWFSKQGIRLLRNANIGHGKIRWDDTVFLPLDRAKEFDRFKLNLGDIVLTLDRPFIVTGTKVARLTAADVPSLLLQRVGRFVETVPGLSDDYLFIWIKSPHFNDQVDPGRSKGVPHISSKQVEAAKLFVPPLAEQRHIVAKVHDLMAVCDRLEACLAIADETRSRLLEALLAEALAPEEDRGLEAA